MRHATPLFDLMSYKGATDKRRFYEEVTLPRNLVVLGDAVCTFNPAYGQVRAYGREPTVLSSDVA